MSTHVSFSRLRRAAYCPRKAYYARREGRSVPEAVAEDVAERRALGYRYPDLLSADERELRALPIGVPPDAYRENLAVLREHPAWTQLVDPNARDRLLTGRDCRGVVHKLAGDPERPVLLSAGSPPEQGVWKPQGVWAVAAAKALAYERERPVESVLVEYPAHAVVRTVDMTTRRKARYRRTLRTVRSMDGPPPRLHDRSKCDPCEYREECGVRTRTLGSLLGG